MDHGPVGAKEYDLWLDPNIIIIWKLRVLKPRNLNSRSLAGPTARLPSNSNAVASGNGTSFHCLLPRLPWLYSHQIAILAAARAASGAQSPTRIHGNGLSHASR